MIPGLVLAIIFYFCCSSRNLGCLASSILLNAQLLNLPYFHRSRVAGCRSQSTFLHGNKNVGNCRPINRCFRIRHPLPTSQKEVPVALSNLPLTASLIFNLIRCFTHSSESQRYSLRRKRAALSLALVVFEDLMMIPINLLVVTFDLIYSLEYEESNDQDAASLLDTFLVFLSAAVGLLTVVAKLSNGCTDACCGNKGYEGDLVALNEFLRDEFGPRREAETNPCCRRLNRWSQMY